MTIIAEPLKLYLKKSIIATRTRSQGDLLMSLRSGSGQVIVGMREWITLFLRLTVMNVKVVTETHRKQWGTHLQAIGPPALIAPILAILGLCRLYIGFLKNIIGLY